MAETIDEELVGLPKVIGDTLRAHPRPVFCGFGKSLVASCGGEDCDWEKPHGVNIKRAWLRHQTWALHMAVKEWYING